MLVTKASRCSDFLSASFCRGDFLFGQTAHSGLDVRASEPGKRIIRNDPMETLLRSGGVGALGRVPLGGLQPF